MVPNAMTLNGAMFMNQTIGVRPSEAEKVGPAAPSSSTYVMKSRRNCRWSPLERAAAIPQNNVTRCPQNLAWELEQQAKKAGLPPPTLLNQVKAGGDNAPKSVQLVITNLHPLIAEADVRAMFEVRCCVLCCRHSVPSCMGCVSRAGRCAV